MDIVATSSLVFLITYGITTATLTERLRFWIARLEIDWLTYLSQCPICTSTWVAAVVLYHEHDLSLSNIGTLVYVAASMVYSLRILEDVANDHSKK
jgi:hypothetical protein